MRIVGGTFKGRRLKTVKGSKTRPTSEKVREALFDILGGSVRGSQVLDLFAGTGAIGLEALSRGAAGAVFVESYRPAASAVRANIEMLGLRERTEVMALSYRAALARLNGRDRKFDIIVADPPYRFLEGKENRNILSAAGKFDSLLPQGIFVLEHATNLEPVIPSSDWRRIRRKEYGQTCLSFFIR